MFEEVVEAIAKFTKQLYRLNLVSIILCFIMWISSVWYAVSMGLKHGLTFEVTTIMGGIERTTTSNTIFNLAMSGAFTWMMLTAVLSYVYLFSMYNANNEGKQL